jgi:ADP-heptose:LPS heptosyltransferase
LRADFWWGGALLYLTGIPRRIGYAIPPGVPFLTHALTFPSAEHATVSNLRLASLAVQTLGYDAFIEPYTPARYPLSFKSTREEWLTVSERLQRAGLTHETALVVIHPGTGGAVKLWRTEAWAHIANWLTSSQLFPMPVHIVLTGSPKEHPMLVEIAETMELSPLLITDLTVGQLAALLVQAQLVLGVDSGPLHMAVAQDTPSLRLYGPTDARIFGPWGDATRHITLASLQKCAGCPLIPCGRLDFSTEELAAHPCVRLITEQQVEGAVSLLILGC